MIDRDILGFDAGSHSVKLVRLRRAAGRLLVRDAEWVRLPAQPEERRRALREVLERRGWLRLPAVVGLGGRGVMLNALEIAPEDPRAVPEIVRLEIERLADLAGGVTLSDYTAFRAGGRRAVLLGMSRAEAVDEALALPREAGVDVCDAVPEALALYHGVRDLDRYATGCTACVNAGQQWTSVTVGRGRRVLFVRVLAAGPDGQAASWAREVAACLRTYAETYAGREWAVRRVVLSGGRALQAGLADSLGQALNVRVRLFGELLGRRAMPEAERFGVAVGLAAAGLRRGGVGLSLFPRVARQVRALRWQMRYWWLTAAAVVAAAAVMTLGEWLDLQVDRETLKVRRAELARVHALQRKLAAYNELNAQLEDRVLPFRAAVRNGAALETVLRAVSDARHPLDWITLLADGSAYFHAGWLPAGTDAEGPARRAGMGQVILEGYTPVDDFSTVRLMIERLRACDGIAGADLLGDERLRDDAVRDARWAGSGARLFAVEIMVPTS